MSEPAEGERDKGAERRISDEARVMLAVSKIEKIIWELPINIAFAALATMAGKAIAGSHTKQEMRSNNRMAFGTAVDSSIRMEEERVAAEALIRRDIDRQIEEKQRQNPLAPVDRNGIEAGVRLSHRQKAKKDAH